MKSESLLSHENKKNDIKLSSAELAKRVVKVKYLKFEIKSRLDLSKIQIKSLIFDIYVKGTYLVDFPLLFTNETFL